MGQWFDNLMGHLVSRVTKCDALPARSQERQTACYYCCCSYVGLLYAEILLRGLYALRVNEKRITSESAQLIDTSALAETSQHPLRYLAGAPSLPDTIGRTNGNLTLETTH